MASVQDHYDQHLGPIYSWMVGGVDCACAQGSAELDAIGAASAGDGVAVDLGAGFGMHAIPLAQRGFTVLAVDSCAVLLDALRARAGTLPIRTVQGDLQCLPRHRLGKPDLVLCMGDTLTHLADDASVSELVKTVAAEIRISGRFVISIRDYSTALTAEQRFIPVRSDENRILTCFLEYSDTQVSVHDVLHQREGNRWNLKVSTYNKLRISPDSLTGVLRGHGFTVHREPGLAGMLRFVAQRV